MREILKSKKEILIFVLSIILFFATVMLISNIINTNKALGEIKENARKETEKALVSSGLAVYTEDLENDVGEGPVSAHNENLPENTTENPQEIGTIVASKANWNIETVTAISVGNGETVPVPKGFYYVGGDLNTGVIISDDEADQYDGETDKTTWEYTTNLKGNQFVWIPCTEEEYTKCEVWNGITQTPSKLANTGWDKTTYTSELPQIRKYGGYYVGRYEMGLAETIPEFTEIQQHTGSNQVYNVEGIPQCKAGVIPWTFIDWNTSKNNAKSMYNTESVSSGLITGTQWDVMLNKMVEKGAIESSDLTSSEKWGNYIDNSIEYTGRMAKHFKTNAWYAYAFGEKTTSKTTSYTSNNGEILTTGASATTERYHIFDLAGNAWEWTDECSLYKANTAKETNIQYRIIRGGCTVQSYKNAPVCYRDVDLDTHTAVSGGARLTLYIK